MLLLINIELHSSLKDDRDMKGQGFATNYNEAERV